MFGDMIIGHFIKLWLIHPEENKNLKFITQVECCKNHTECCLSINLYRSKLFEHNIEILKFKDTKFHIFSKGKRQGKDQSKKNRTEFKNPF